MPRFHRPPSGRRQPRTTAKAIALGMMLAGHVSRGDIRACLIPVRLPLENREGYRNAHREMWVIRFALDRTLPDRYMAQNSEEGYTESAARGLKDEPPALHEHEWDAHVGANLGRTHQEWLGLGRARKGRPHKHRRMVA
jgi:hypothetical protein